MTKWPEIRDSKKYKNWYETNKECESQRLIFEKTYQGIIDTWDYQWEFACKLNKRISILPTVNLISNIGFDENATHTKEDNQFSNMVTKEIIFPLRHPEEVKINNKIIKKNMDNSKLNIIYKIYQKLKNY